MKKKRTLFGAAVFALLFIFTIALSNRAEACRPGKVYAEGERFLGICWGRSGDECAKCVSPAR